MSQNDVEVFPDRFLRGMPGIDSQWFKDGVVQPYLFKTGFSDPESTGNNEMSINWYDDEGAIAEIMNRMHKDGSRFHFLGGVAVVLREEVDRLKIMDNYKGLISYERKIVDGNNYHGNILISCEKNNVRISILSNILASNAKRITREEWGSN